MAIFRKQSIRLLREKWTDPQNLAEEIFGILNSDEPIEIDGPVTINNNTDQSPLTINNYSNSDDDVTINRYPDDPPDLPNYPPPPPMDTGDVITIHINQDGIDRDRKPPNDPGPPTSDPLPGGGGGFPGQVVSGGPGDTYTVNVYENGLNQPFAARTVIQLQIHDDATIPAGTWALIGKVGNEYFMQVPVWL